MASSVSFRPAPGSIPDSPGVYRFFDANDRVIYVGKAKSLRSRLNSYFQDPAGLHFRTRTMVETAVRVDWMVVANEVEALAQEYTWIKEFEPRFNVRFRDDKSYPYLAVSMSDEVPRAMVTRGSKKAGTKYFGPYAHAWAIRETLDLLLRVFPIRTCSNGVYKRAVASGRPCLLGYIDKCSAPCVGRISSEDHRALVDEFCRFMGGRTKDVVARLTEQMHEAAGRQEFETAAQLRDDLAAIETVMERNSIVLPDGTNADAIAFIDDDLEVAAYVLHIREGRIRGQRSLISDKPADLDGPQVMSSVISQLYGDSDESGIPPVILASQLPADTDDLHAWLTNRKGRAVRILAPERGDKRHLIETIRANAEQALTQHKMRRTGNLADRTRALQDLHDSLDLPASPLRIECIDISHFQGESAVGSVIVFEDALPRTNHYRTYNISEENSGDDVASIAEVVTRRFSQAHKQENTTRYAPSLLVIDGGMPQVSSAAAALTAIGVHDIPVIGLAKRLEEIFTADGEVIVLPRGSDGLYLLQRVRDEAHRFAITAHRRRQSKRMQGSELDLIPGVGPKRRNNLLKEFGSLKRLREANLEQISAVPGIGPELAGIIHSAIHADEGTSGA